MSLLCLILLLSVSTLYFIENEYDAVFSVYAPAYALRRNVQYFLVFAVMAGCIAVCSRTSLPVMGIYEGMYLDCKSALVVVLSVLLSLSLMNFLSMKGSGVYAFLGAFAVSRHVLYDGELFIWPALASLAAAPFMAFILSSALNYLIRKAFDKKGIHLITLSSYMRIAVVSAVILTSAALGLNWGGFILGTGMMAYPDSMSLVCAISLCIIALVLFIYMFPIGTKACSPSGSFEDFSIYSVVSVGIAVATTILFFSFDCTTSFLGLVPMPLSVSALVFAAIAGASVAQKSKLVETEEYVREAVSMVAAPVLSAIFTYLLLFVIDADADEQMMDFTVIAAALILLFALSFVGYVRNQRRMKEATDRLVYSQQQQIYENSRALNDMELKVVLSENQALHNSIEMKRQEVMNVALSIVEQKEYLESLNVIVKKLSSASTDTERDELISELSASLKQRLSYDSDVDSQYFYAQAEYLHEDFNAKLAENFPNLTQQERRLATLLRLGFSSKYIATLMNITPKSVEISRYRLRQKLGLSKGDNLVNFIKSI